MLVQLKVYRARKRTLGYGFDVSLPLDWARQNGITGKEDVEWCVDTEKPDCLILRVIK